jgi:hypothetical protein
MELIEIDKIYNNILPYFPIDLGLDSKVKFQHIIKVIDFSLPFRKNVNIHEHQEGIDFRKNLNRLLPENFSVRIQKSQDKEYHYNVYAEYYGKKYSWVQIDDIYPLKNRFWSRIFGLYKNTYTLTEIYLDELKKK